MLFCFVCIVALRSVGKTRLEFTSAWPTTACSSTAPEQRLTATKKKHSRVTSIPAACHPPLSVRSHFKNTRAAVQQSALESLIHHADQINYSERWQCSDVQQSTYQRLQSNAFSRLAWAELLLQQTRPSLQALQFWDHDNTLRFGCADSTSVVPTHKTRLKVQKNAKFEKHVFWCIAISQPSPNSLLGSRQNFGPCRSHFWGPWSFFFF